ncbi:ferroxidase fet3 [Coemansia erecta]|nr:ferroxidase fet3 [Coemansia erecta]
MKEVQLVVRNSDSGSHPIHMHTAQFQIIARGTLPYNETQGLQPSHAPMRRDTIMVAAGEFAVLRFRADNLGVLFVHCHIVTLHQYTGLATQFIVGPDVMQQTMRVPKVIYDQCQQQGIAVSGAAREQDGPVLYPAGWTARAKGALAGCILAALFGFATILWYGWNSAKYQPVPETVAEN